MEILYTTYRDGMCNTRGNSKRTRLGKNIRRSYLVGPEDTVVKASDNEARGPIHTSAHSKLKSRPMLYTHSKSQNLE